MRLSTEMAADPDLGLATIATALDAGITLFDTARAYAPGEGELGHNERLLARALQAHPLGRNAHVVTKCGMRRDGGAWIPDGRAKQIAEEAAASVEALGGIVIDVLLLHVPDPRVALSTTARALARILEDGLARRVGVSNVSRKQLEEIAAHVPVAAVEVALGAYDDLPIRNGVVAYCIERGIEILAHAPLGGPERARRLARDPQLAPIAAQYDGVNSADVFLAYLLAARPEIIPIVGARSPKTARRIAAAASLHLEDDDLAKMDARFPVLGALRRPAPAAGPRDAEIVLMVGVAGAGKSRAAETYVARGYERLNRDTAGGSLRAIAQRLDERLGSGASRFVLDNTYVTRASRSDVLRVAARHGARVRCVFFDTPLHEAQVNVVLRMLERFGRVPAPEEIASLARSEPAALAPHALSRMTREFEPAALDEGFSDIASIPFVREHPSGRRAGIIAPLAAFEGGAGLEIELSRLIAASPEGAPCLLFAWRPGADESFLAALQASVQSLAQSSDRAIEIACCPHPAGPPICWCRPPLPALFLSFARRHMVDLRASILYGSSPTERTIARVLGMSLRTIPTAPKRC
jgi:aryl-alcohol dehydrogenase-like predicted oxidoreductase